MGTVYKGDRESQTLVPGRVLRVTANAQGAGLVFRMERPGVSYPGVVSLVADQSVDLGPYNTQATLEVVCTEGILSTQQLWQSTVFDDSHPANNADGAVAVSASGFRGYGTIAARNALTGLVVGDVFYTNDPIAPAGYAGNNDVCWRWDGTSWRVLNGMAVPFANRALLGHSAGGWGVNTEVIQPGCDLLLPAGLLGNDGDQFTVDLSMYKAGTGSTEAVEWRMRFGSDANGLLNPEIRPTWTLDHNAGAGTKARQVHQRWTYVRRSATTMTSVSKAMADSNSAPYGSINNSADSQSPDMTDFTVPNLDSTATRLSFTLKQITLGTTSERWVVTRLRLTLEQ